METGYFKCVVFMVSHPTFDVLLHQAFSTWMTDSFVHDLFSTMYNFVYSNRRILSSFSNLSRRICSHFFMLIFKLYPTPMVSSFVVVMILRLMNGNILFSMMKLIVQKTLEVQIGIESNYSLHGCSATIIRL